MAFNGNKETKLHSWLLRCAMKPSEVSLNIMLPQDGTEQILIRHLEIAQAYEYARNKLIISIHPANLLLVDNWFVTNEIADANELNTEKYWVLPLPNFNPDSFPFLVCSGRESFNLVNVKTAKMEVMIKASGKCLYG